MDETLLDQLTSIVSSAAAAILAARTGALEVETKPDLSPLTTADRAAEAVILEGLARALPGVPVVSEEATGHTAAAPLATSFVLVDPLDGTRELLAGRDEFTVNLAVISDGRPVLGIVAAPALGMLWRAAQNVAPERVRLAPGLPAKAAHERRVLRCRSLRMAELTAALSRSHLDPCTEALLSRLPPVARIASGSALKFCRLAEGVADVYPRLAPTGEWDVAAGDALVTQAGGIVISADGTRLRYGQIAENFRIPAFVAWGDPSAPAKLGFG